MNPQMDPEMDPESYILGNHCQIKALQGSFKVHIDKFTNLKLKFAVWFEDDPTFGSRDIAFLILDGPIAPPRL